MAKKPKSASSIDLDALSMDELQKLAREVKAAIQAKEKTQRAEAKKALEAVAKEHGFTVAELLGTSAAPKKAAGGGLPPKYRNPADPSDTWSGRGRQPQWYKDALAAGNTPADLAI